MFFSNIDDKMIIRVDDTTDHGGRVLTGEDRMMIMGRPVARIGDKVWCPLCKNEYEIIEGDENIQIFERHIAFEGHLTSCGARLISSLGGNHSQAIGLAPNLNVMDGILTADVSGNNDIALRNTLSEGSQNNISRNYGFVKAQDLYEEDKRKIIATYKEAIDEMISKGLRHDGDGFLNAFKNNIFSDEFLGKFTGDQFIRCEPQSIFVLRKLYPLKPELHLNWGFRMPYTPRVHYWVEAIPLSFEGLIPYEVIVLDPLKGSIDFQIIPSDKPLAAYAHGTKLGDPSDTVYE